MACKCYHAERNFIGKIGVCWGTKEREACSCGGDESKCDFYEDKRKKETPKTTNADRIRSMTDEELARFINFHTVCEECPAKRVCEDNYTTKPGVCVRSILAWLKSPVEEEQT